MGHIKHFRPPHTDLKHKIRQIMTKKWQLICDQNTYNKFYQIQPIPKERKLGPNDCRTEETTLARLRIDQTRWTHFFIVKEEPPSRCPCGNQYTVKYILIECTDLTHTRWNFANFNSMKELFGKIDPKNILNFLKRIVFLSRMY